MQEDINGLQLIQEMNERLMRKNNDLNSSFHSKFSKNSKLTGKSRRFTIEVSIV